MSVVSKGAGAEVLELVRHVRRPEKDVTGRGLDRRLADCKPRPALPDDEDLVVGVHVQRWPRSDFHAFEEQHGHVRADVAPFETAAPEIGVARPVGSG